MAVKKKAGKKKKASSSSKKKGGGSDGTEGMNMALSDDKLKYMESKTQALEMQLAYRTEVTATATKDYKYMRERLKEANERLEQAEQETIDITKDMTRQYKGMQDDLLNKINQRENFIQNLKDDLVLLKEKQKRELERRDKIDESKDMYIKNLKLKMEELSANFGQMLSESLRKMNERLEVNSTRRQQNDEEEQVVVPIQRRMEEYNFKVSCSTS